MNRIPVFDGHNDTLLNLHLPDRGEGRSFFERSELGHIDLIRAREGGFGGGFFACYTPNPEDDGWNEESALTVTEDGYEISGAPPLDPEYALDFTDGLVKDLYHLEKESDGALRIVRTADELEECLRDGIVAAILHFEGAENLGSEPGALERYYEAGLRSLGLVWSRPNAFATGVPFAFPGSPDQGPGLTDQGRALVRACRDLGMLVDVSHLNARGFWDVAGMLDGPIVASHSGAHALCASPRNLTDEQLRAVGQSGGIVGINFHVGFLREDGEDDADTPLERIAEHAAYVAGIAGPAAVALGSDFDGATMPAALGDVTGLPALLDALRTVGGFGEAELEGVAYRNWHRVLAAAWAA